MSRNDDGLPMLPPWLSESDVTQVGYEAPVQNLPSDEEAPAPRRSRFRNRAPEGERPESGRREKRRRGWRRGDEAPAAGTGGDLDEDEGGARSASGEFGHGAATERAGDVGEIDAGAPPRFESEGTGDRGSFEARSSASEFAPRPSEQPEARHAESAPSAQSEAGHAPFAPGSGQPGAWHGEFAGENGRSESEARSAEFAPAAGGEEIGPGAAVGRPIAGAEAGAPELEGQRGEFGPRGASARHESGTQREDEALRDPRNGAVVPEESPRPTLPTRNPSSPSSAFQPLGAGASAAGGLREASAVRERRRARPELPPPPPAAEPPERLSPPNGSAGEQPESVAPHRDLAGFREGLSALRRDAEPEPEEPLERGQIGTPDALPPRAPVAPVTGGSVPPWQVPGGGPYGPPQAEPESAPELAEPEQDSSAYQSAPARPVVPQNFEVPAAGPLYPPAPPHAAPTAYPTPPAGNGSPAPDPVPSPPPYSTSPTNVVPVPGADRGPLSYGPNPDSAPQHASPDYGHEPNRAPAEHGEPNRLYANQRGLDAQPTASQVAPPRGPAGAPLDSPAQDGAPRYDSAPNHPQANSQYGPGPNQSPGNQQYGPGPNQPSGNQQYGPGPNQPSGNPQYGPGPNQPPVHPQYGPGPNQPPGNPPYGPGPNPYDGRQFNATPPNTYTSTPPPSLDDVPMRRARKSPGSGWRKAVHHVSGGAINPGMSAEERRLQELVARIRQPVRGDYRIAVLSLKGGVGKTTTTVGLGSIFASIRGDRVIAVDANPDFGTLSQRVPLQTRSTVRDLLLDPAIQRYSDVRRHTSQGTSRLEVLASERDPAASEAFSDEEYRAVARILQRFYNIILTDCGTGLMHSAMSGVLETAHSLVLISSAAIDGARSAAATLDWLSLHGHDHLVRNAVVVINLPREGSPTVGVQHLREYFLSRCRAVHIIPYDGHLSEGAEIDLHRLHKNTKRAYVELAATVADEFAVYRS
ncbi:AAA family ATPase [Nocardia sp. NPDC057353]|uniref:MinD/ParA family ATP-binding protein n=1 Tax=Nocardia sp. NPDC057353 TaxID=3346104 RepID=UPI0036417956